jgi:tetratricopeptide (TPR) repeat protein
MTMATVAELRKRIEPSDRLFAEGRIEEACAALIPLAEAGVQYFRPYHNLGAYNYRLRRYTEAVAYLTAAIERYPEYWESHFILGQASLALRQFERAELAFRAALAMAPDNIRVAVWLARSLGQRGDRAAADVVIRGTAARIGWNTPAARQLTFAQEPWFLAHIANWRKHLAPAMGQIGQALEIGCMEGLSTIWTVEHLLAPAGGIVVNDLAFRPNFLDNLRNAGFDHRAMLRPGTSALVLPQLAPASFDFVYVDGDHRPSGAFRDAVNALAVVRDGGYIVLDDFGKENEQTAVGLGLFLKIFADQLEILDQSYQVFLRRRTPAPRLGERAIGLLEAAIDQGSAAELAALPRGDAGRLAWLRRGGAGLRAQ